MMTKTVKGDFQKNKNISELSPQRPVPQNFLPKRGNKLARLLSLSSIQIQYLK
jgi:hypothetical protein